MNNNNFKNINAFQRNREKNEKFRKTIDYLHEKKLHIEIL